MIMVVVSTIAMKVRKKKKKKEWYDETQIITKFSVIWVAPCFHSSLKCKMTKLKVLSQNFQIQLSSS
jgi:hypothetical protein